MSESEDTLSNIKTVVSIRHVNLQKTANVRDVKASINLKIPSSMGLIREIFFKITKDLFQHTRSFDWVICEGQIDKIGPIHNSMGNFGMETIKKTLPGAGNLFFLESFL